MIGGSILTLLVKMMPYVIVMKLVGGVVDVGIHYTKLKISKNVTTDEQTLNLRSAIK